MQIFLRGIEVNDLNYVYVINLFSVFFIFFHARFQNAYWTDAELLLESL